MTLKHISVTIEQPSLEQIENGELFIQPEELPLLSSCWLNPLCEEG